MLAFQADSDNLIFIKTLLEVQANRFRTLDLAREFVFPVNHNACCKISIPNLPLYNPMKYRVKNYKRRSYTSLCRKYRINFVDSD
jgi:hypothetical protein